ncbi:MAG TPA: hypothetical protein VFA79_02435 [Myxococcales bacterium]|nr:hypothetical protein [Myxococcales bacterium]
MTGSRWSIVAEDVFCPAAAPVAERGVALLTRSAEGELMYREGDAQGLGPARSLGVPIARVPGSSARIPVEWPITVCSARDGDLHLLARGAEGDLVHGRLRAGEWSGFESIGVPVVEDQGDILPMGLAGAPVACCRERGRLDVFAVSGEGNLLHTRYDADGFAECTSLGGIPSSHGREWPVFGAISAFDAGLRGMGVVARSMSGDLLVKLWDGAAWGPFAPLQTAAFDPLDPALQFIHPPSGPPAACGGGSTRADVFVRGPRGDLLHSFWDGTVWSALQSIGRPPAADGVGLVPFTAGPIACAWGRFRLDVFATAADGKLYRAQTDGTWKR